MNKKITKPKYAVIENDEYFYRHPEMFRSKLDDEAISEEEVKIEYLSNPDE